MQQFLWKDRKYLVTDVVLAWRQKTNELHSNVFVITELDRELWKIPMSCAGTLSEKKCYTR